MPSYPNYSSAAGYQSSAPLCTIPSSEQRLSVMAKLAEEASKSTQECTCYTSCTRCRSGSLTEDSPIED